MTDHAGRSLPDSGGPLNSVEVDMGDGIWVLIYGSGPDFPVFDTSYIPAALIEEPTADPS